MRLFGTSGIRALVNEELTVDLALDLGRALASFLGSGSMVLIGKDTRTSGDMLESAIVAGLTSCGVDVVSLGIAPTPAIAFLTKWLGYDAGISITASHNPPEYNGIKFWDSRGMAFTQDKERKIEEILSERSFPRVSWRDLGSFLYSGSILDDYIDYLAGIVDLSGGRTIAVDCGNGATCLVTPRLLRMLGYSVLDLNSQPDGFFPGRSPEPTEENLRDLARLVRASGAILGIAHDGDGDRLAIIDERGRYVDGDTLLALFAKLEIGRGDLLVTTVDASMIVDRVVEEQGGRIVRTKVGDVSVAEEIARSGAKLGGEPSGCFIFPEVSMCPDGPFASLKVLEIVEELGSISKLVDELPRAFRIRRKVECPNHLKRKVLDKLRGYLEGEEAEILDIDGLRLEYEDSWVLLRPSGTEPYFRITVEAWDESKARELAQRYEELVRRAISEIGD